jgi:lipoate-protein ligase A
MADNWRLILDPAGEPQANMASDEAIAREVLEGSSPLTLRIYRWERAAVSLGRRQEPEKLPSGIAPRGFTFVRRPTGGGAVVHSIEELTYALAIPRGAMPENCPLNQLPGFFHSHLRDVLVERGWVSGDQLTLQEKDSAGPFHACFSAPVRGDLLWQGRKAAGSALRAWRGGALIQGSIQGLPVWYDRLADALVEALKRSFLAHTQFHHLRGEGPGFRRSR